MATEKHGNIYEPLLELYFKTSTNILEKNPIILEFSLFTLNELLKEMEEIDKELQ